MALPYFLLFIKIKVNNDLYPQIGDDDVGQFAVAVSPADNDFLVSEWFLTSSRGDSLGMDSVSVTGSQQPVTPPPPGASPS